MPSTSPGATRLPIVDIEHDAVAAKAAAEGEPGDEGDDDRDGRDEDGELDRAVEMRP